MTVRHPNQTRTSEAIRRVEAVGSILGEQLALLRPKLDTGDDGRLTPEAEAALEESMRVLRRRLHRSEPSKTK